MRIPAKILAILILLTAIFTVIACNKPNLTAGDITSSSSTTYTVTFNSAFSNNGCTTQMPSPASITVTPPATTIGSLPSNPRMLDSNGNDVYTFGGWWTATGGGGTQLTASTTITSDVTVYAYWYKYQVTFQSDGSTYAIRGTIPPSTTVDSLPSSPTKTGYTFAGWYESDGVTQFFGNTEVPSSGITVSAKWFLNTSYTVYAVTYDGNGGTSIGAQYVISPATTVVTLPLKNPTYLFHKFNGWNTLADGGSTGVQFTASTPVTADITVYAQWSANPGYTVTFNSGWGTSVDAQYVIPEGATVSTSTWPTSAWPTDPTKPCYTFDGWNTKADGSGDTFTASTPVTKDITVYAQWTWVGGTTKSTYAIGDPGPSCVGKVFYITNGGKNGLEAAPPGWYDWYSADADPSLVWISGDPDASGNQQTQTTLNGNTSTAIGTGKANSDAIITQSGTTASSNSAAELCEAYVGGGYNDWFLPSKDELAQLYANQDMGQWGGFEDRYWSSSEYNTWYSWSQFFTDGTQSSTLKSGSLHFRPVRHF